MTSNIKEALYNICAEYIDKRIESARQVISEAQQSANQEGKSSAGDKYETGRAMMQLEIEKNSQQLSESLKVKQALERISLEGPRASVQPGSLVITDKGDFFIAISLGKVSVHGKSYIVISPSSPLGLKLMRLKVGDEAVFNGETYVVQKII